MASPYARCTCPLGSTCSCGALTYGDLQNHEVKMLREAVTKLRNKAKAAAPADTQAALGLEGKP